MTTVAYPQAPATSPLKGTLLDSATVTDQFAWHTGESLYDSYNCMQFGESAEFCAENAKTLDQTAGWIDGFRFAVYGGVVCKAIGLDQTRMRSEVIRVFEVGESTAVERALMSTRFQANADADHGWPAPTDITPAGGAVKPSVGIALLEGYSGSVYVGAPTLHVPLSIASLILGVDGAEFQGSVLQTKMGSIMVAGAGYDYPNTGPDGSDAAPGERWLYATGQVYVARSDSILLQEMDRSTNEVFVLAERGYIVAVDCFAAAVRVQVTA